MEIRSPSPAQANPVSKMLYSERYRAAKSSSHNPVLAYENGEDFMEFWYKAERGELDPFVLVVEGSIPNERLKAKATGQPWNRSRYGPADHNQRVDRPSCAQGAGGRCDRNVRDLRRHSRDGGNPTAVWACRLSWMGMAVDGRAANSQRPRLSGATRQLYGNLALPALSSGRASADDSAR